MKRRKKNKGFTLVELLIVIGISGILMAMAAPKYQGMVDKATQLEQRANAREVLSYIDIYNLEATPKIDETKTLADIKTTITIKGFSDATKQAESLEGMTITNLRVFAEKGTTPTTIP